MDIREFLTMLLMARQGQQQPSFGRAGGVAPGMPLKPVQGVGTGMGGPLMQQDFGPGQPPAPVVNRDVGTQPGPSEPGGVLYEAGALAARQAAQNAAPRSASGSAYSMLGGSGDVQVQPFSPPPLDPGAPLPAEGMGSGLDAGISPLGMGHFVGQGLLGGLRATPIGGNQDPALEFEGPSITVEGFASDPRYAPMGAGAGFAEGVDLGPPRIPGGNLFQGMTERGMINAPAQGEAFAGLPDPNSGDFVRETYDPLEERLMQQQRAAHEKLFLELLRKRGLLR